MAAEGDFYKQNTLPDFSPEKNAPALPKKIGPYKIESLLSKGGMSLLYLGVHSDTKQPIAIKVLSPDYVTHHDAVARFLRESEIIALANHPNIVKLYGQGEWEGGLYIAMEFIRGVSLRQFIMQQSLSLKRSLDIILQVAYALLHLHTHGVIHRDLKPENILITEEGEIKVIDFGIAALHDDFEVKAGGKRKMMGTPHYMSPEQKENPSKVTYASDIYSLGIIAYELVLGKLSYGMINLNLLPGGLRKIIGKALAISVKERYQDIVDFITDISQYLKSGEWEKDRPGTDQVKEILETLQKVSANLSPYEPPVWPDVEVGVAKYKNASQMGLYYDFFKFPNDTYGIFLSVTSSGDIDGVAYSAQLRGEMRAYLHEKSLFTTQDIKPDDLLAFLTEIFRQAPIDQQFAFHFMVLNPLTNQFSFVTCGLGGIYHLTSGHPEPRLLTASNPALGAPILREIAVTTDNWNVGDTLILHTLQAEFATEVEEEEASLVLEAVRENALLSAQTQAEGILKKSVQQSLTVKRHPKALISLQRIA